MAERAIQPAAIDSHARHIASKIATDLKRVQILFGMKQPSDDAIRAYEKEITLLLSHGCLGEVTYGFERNGKWVYAIRYVVAAAGNLMDCQSADFADARPCEADAARFASFLRHSARWKEVRHSLEREFPVKRSNGSTPDIEGEWTPGRKYTSGGLKVARHMVQRDSPQKKELPVHKADSLLTVCREYTKTLVLLRRYDEDSQEAAAPEEICYPSEAEIAFAVDGAKKFLQDNGENAGLFGNLPPGKGGAASAFARIQEDFYPDIESKAANLFYFIVKNHCYSDGNKRIAAIMLLWFLDMNGILALVDEEKTLPYNVVFALAIHVAKSDRTQKDALVELIAALIKAYFYVEANRGLLLDDSDD